MASVRRLKVDGGIPRQLAGAAEAAHALERDGYDGGWTAETSHDPFLPLLLGRRTHVATRARHQHRGGVCAQSDDRRQHRLGPAGLFEGPVHPWSGHPDPAPHREAIQHAVESSGTPDARIRCCAAGDLVGVAGRHQASFRGRLLHPQDHDPDVHARAAQPSRTEGFHRRRWPGDDRNVRGSRRRPPRSPLRLQALPR